MVSKVAMTESSVLAMAPNARYLYAHQVFHNVHNYLASFVSCNYGCFSR